MDRPHNPKTIRAKSAPDAILVDDDPAQLLVAENRARMSATIVNNGPDTVYVGKDATVTAADGIPIASGSSLNDKSSTDDWYGICDTGDTADVRVIEV